MLLPSKQPELSQSKLPCQSIYKMVLRAMAMWSAQPTMIYLKSLAKKGIAVSKVILGQRIRRLGYQLQQLAMAQVALFDFIV